MIEATIRALYPRLLAAYGPQHWWPADSPFEVCIGAILTQNTSWTNVEKAIQSLKDANALSPSRLTHASPEQLQAWIRPAGFFRQKSRRIQAFCRFLLHHGGMDALAAWDSHALRTALLDIHGIGPETADSMLLYAWRQPVFVIDAYTRRLLSRLACTPITIAYDALQAHFHRALPRQETLFNEYHALIVEHAKRHCRSRPRCTGCPLVERCRHPSSASKDSIIAHACRT
ncbi:MAG: hypothetical protein D6678_00760 [Zetaproteobacteria bacterium]|nr:MAG: hypothetical protein D6678_00760 [Zetaproteobacteria bacterium]